MTTTTDHLATLGLTMDDARGIVDSLLPDNTEALISGCQYFGITGPMLGDILGFIPGDYSEASLSAGYSLAIEFVMAGEADALIDLCEYVGITASQLGASVGLTASELRFVLDSYFGVDSSDLAGSVPDPVVSAVSNASANEGGELDFEVTLSGPTVVETRYDLAASGAALGDIANYTISGGVLLDAPDGQFQVVVPAGVSSFTFTLVMTADDEDTTDETLTLNIGGQAGTGTVYDDDTEQPPATNTLLPEELTGMAGLMRLNGQTGILSTASLEAEIVAQTNATDYAALFDASAYVEAADGWFTGAEIGWQLGHIPATDANVASVFYGTVIHALKAVDWSEFSEIDTYLDSTGEYIDATELHMLVQLMVDAFSDAATVRVFSDDDIAALIVQETVDLVGMVEYQPSVFHALINWAL